ncbi:unnamed protein product [Urochloa humidicola]
MDKLVTLFHGGTIKENAVGGFEFENMERLPLFFSARPTYSGIVDRVKEKLWMGEHVDVKMEGVIDVGSKGPRIKRLIAISCQADWENYMAFVMDSEVRALDLFVQNVYTEAVHHGISLDMNNSPVNVVFEPHVVPCAPSEVAFTQPEDFEDDVGGGFATDVPCEVEETIPNPEPSIAVAAPIVCEASNRGRVDINGDDDTYEAMRAIDSDDDRPVCPLSPDSIRMLRRLFPGRDPLIPDFCDLSQSHRAIVDGGDEDLEILSAASGSLIEKGHVFKDIAALKMWLKESAVVHNRPFRVKNSHAERRYTIKCEAVGCAWKVCARKVKGSDRFKITSVVGPHSCGSAEPDQKHRQLTSKFIATSLMPIVKQMPMIRVRAVIEIVKFKWKYTIKYGKAWRAQQRALKMVYGDWEEAYERLPVMLNAMQAANPGMIWRYEHVPDVELNGRRMFNRAFWCFRQCIEAFTHCRPVVTIDGTFLTGKYLGTLLVAIGADANNCLVPLAFGLVDRESKDSW